jgi:serine/threonine-protein kinase
MQDLRRAQVKAAFHALVELPPDAREAAWPGLDADDEIRREVVSLLAAHDQAAGFLSQRPGDGLAPPSFRDDAAPDVTAVGSFVGPYLLLSVIGAGGMGTVYHAVRADDAFEMHVAIKIVRRGMDSADILRRFLIERQTLARLDHPNIAKLLDGGSTESGQPYLVMELVRGPRIDRYCNSANLNVADRVRLFRQVCAGVEYAHQQLVLHRDLKPDNVLVTEAGAPKLVDFGIARLMATDADDADNVTRLHGRRMTLNYASPEQVRGDVMGTASDVYSLGVILYELLTGQLPYQQPATSVAAFEAAIASGPIPPSTRVTSSASLRRELRGDLDTMVLRTLAADPARRYTSVRQLADDLGRFLTGRPVIARPDTMRYRGSKFVRRHRVATAALVITSTAIVTGAGAAVWQAREARIERDRAEAEMQRAQRLSDFMATVLAEAGPAQSGRTVTVVDALARAAERAEADLADTPEDLAQIRLTVGTTYLQLGHLDQAVDVLSRTVAQRRVLSPGSGELVTALLALCDAQESVGDLEGAGAHCDEALSLARTVYGTVNAAVAQALQHRASVAGSRGELAAAESLHRETLEVMRQLPNADPSALASTLNNLAVAVGTAGRWLEAVPLQREALDLITAVRGDRHPEVAVATSSLATALEASGEYAEAEPLYLRALALREDLLGPTHPGTASTLLGYTMMLAEMGQATRALPSAERLVTIARTLPTGHPLVAASLLIAGRVTMEAGDPAAAEPLLREALTLRDAALPRPHWLRASSEGWLGECLIRLKQYAEAERLLVQSHTTLRDAFGPDDKRVQDATVRLARLAALMTPARR